MSARSVMRKRFLPKSLKTDGPNVRQCNSGGPLQFHTIAVSTARSKFIKQSRPEIGEQFLERVEFVKTPMEEVLRLFSKEANMKVVASDTARDLPVTVTINNLPAT